jgi:hypothetical protein
MRIKYVKIERGEGFKNTYTTLKVAEHALKAGTVQSYKPVTLKQIKAERLNEYREDHYFRHVAEDAFQAAYHDKTFKATVIYWSGSEGLVKIEGVDLMLQTIYACNIKGAKTWYPETACVSYTKGQAIDVTLKVFTGGVLFVCGNTPGILDQERWDRIKDTNLAFRCDDNGVALNGLFG